MPEFIHGEETRALLGACFEVYREKGCGFLEAVFQECLEFELADRRIPFEALPPLSLEYKGRRLKQVYQPDFLCFGKVVLEIRRFRSSPPSIEHRSTITSGLQG